MSAEHVPMNCFSWRSKNLTFCDWTSSISVLAGIHLPLESSVFQRSCLGCRLWAIFGSIIEYRSLWFISCIADITKPNQESAMTMSLHKKWSFPLRISLVNVTKSGYLVTIIEEILNGQLHFSCSVCSEPLRESVRGRQVEVIAPNSFARSFFSITYLHSYISLCMTMLDLPSHIALNSLPIGRGFLFIFFLLFRYPWYDFTIF